MRAIVCSEYGTPDQLELKEVDDPDVGPGQVEIEVRSAGVNFPDLLIIQGLYQIKPPPPFSPGGEVAGIVRRVGEGVTQLAPGDRVMALTGFGGFAERVVVGPDQVTRLPDGVDLTAAGGFTFTYATSYHALVDRGAVRPGETLLVLGAAGGVGITAVELGRMLGAKVIAAASTEEKLDLAERYGASGRINYASEDLKKQAKALGGVDVVYDPVGGELSEPALRALRPGGRHLVIGFASGTIPSIPLNLPLLKECQIVGVAWGSWAMRLPDEHRAHMNELLSMWQRGELSPHVSEARPLADAPAVLQAMARREIKGKVVLTPDS